MRAPFEYGDSQFTPQALAEKRLVAIEAAILRLTEAVARLERTDEQKGTGNG